MSENTTFVIGAEETDVDTEELPTAFSYGKIVLLISTIGLGCSLILKAAEYETISRVLLLCTTCILLAFLLIEIVRKISHGEYGLDLVAALAMGSSIVFGEYLAGTIVGIMYAGGQFLEDFAYGRAEKGMSALLQRVPRKALRFRVDGLESVPIEQVAVGDSVLVRKGDVVPADGRLVSEFAVIDKSVMTGEPLPQRVLRGAFIPSGASNSGEAIELKVLNIASDSTYSGIVRLVEASRKSKARLMRFADRFAVWFLVLTLCVGGFAVFLSGDISRIVAVLVVATPCPLILAVPVAFAAGSSKAANLGVLVKGAGPLEALSEISIVVMDKTGTLTSGRPVVFKIYGLQSADRILQLAASLDQASSHVVGRALVDEARSRGIVLFRPEDVVEDAGAGISGGVDGLQVQIGGLNHQLESAQRQKPQENELTVQVMVNGNWLGDIFLKDQLRPDAAEFVQHLRSIGINRLVLASGDAAPASQFVGDALSLTEVRPRLTPAEKVQTVVAESAAGNVLMIGDGVNDAPALAVASVGLAVGNHNLAAAAQAADAVLLKNDLRLIPQSIEIARSTKTIALQSVYAGLGLSIVAMGFAASGYLPPVTGAILQEVIDVAVVLNALRAL